MLHKLEAIMGLPEDSLTHQMEEHYLEGEYPEDMGCKTLNEPVQCSPTYTTQTTDGLHWSDVKATQALKHHRG